MAKPINDTPIRSGMACSNLLTMNWNTTFSCSVLQLRFHRS
jgi:hypothetical protein